jgi:Ca2+:H+ antiporter
MVFTWMLLAVPVSLALEYFFHVSPVVVFAGGLIAIIPLAEWMRRATEHLAGRLGPGIGGLLNVTFGNLAEMMLAVFVLLDGQAAVVKGQLTGSIIGNGLLGLGLAIVVGSWGRRNQTFSRESAGRLSSLLILSMIALLMPALFDLTERGVSSYAAAQITDEKLSLGVSFILIAVYLANLVYTLVTHRDIYGSADEAEAAVSKTAPQPLSHWPVWKALAVLVVATAFVAWEAEIISGALTATAGALGVSTFFLGVIVLAVIGNAAEYVAAVYFARKDQMSMVMTITVGSSIQIALFVAPALVIMSWLLGRPMNLVFSNPLELIAIASVAFSVNAIANDGETTWFEGVLLLAVYAMFVLAFFFVAPASAH